MWYNSPFGAIMEKKQKVLNVKETKVHPITRYEQDYISLTDMVKIFGDKSLIRSWMRNRELAKAAIYSLVRGDHKKHKQERDWLINENSLITV
jgi:hypothetical protein